jgi:DNA-binding NtrC family response regulator
MTTQHLLHITNVSETCIPREDIADMLGPRWEVHSATNPYLAGELVQRHVMVVGLVELGEESVRVFPEWIKHLCLSRSHIYWIGILSPACIRYHKIIELMTTSCHTYHLMPIDRSHLHCSIDRARDMAALTSLVAASHPKQGLQQPHTVMLGHSQAIQTMVCRLQRFAQSEAPVLLTGESGTGKELAARIIHDHSARAEKPFIAVNCGALHPSLAQSELFGHERGAFTGAHQRKIGRIEAAYGGTILLDEIGDIQPDVQVNLLRFLQEGYIERVGSVNKIKIDVRVIAATHIDLDQAIKQKTFRDDLYYRLNVLNAKLPPLRERPGDAELLARFFFDKFRAENPRPKGFSQDAFGMIRAYPWPGNIRELINCVRRATLMCENRLITPDDLGLERRHIDRISGARTLYEIRATAETNAILAALRSATDVASAARQLGVSRAQLYRLIDKYSIDYDRAEKRSQPLRRESQHLERLDGVFTSAHA